MGTPRSRVASSPPPFVEPPGHLQVSPPDTVYPERWPRAAGTPHSPPVSLRRLALTASGTRAPSPEWDCATGGPCGKERAPGTHLTSHRSRRLPAGRARTRAPPPGAQPCRGARAWGAAAYGEPCVPGSPGLLRCDTRSCWEAQGAARSRAGLRRAGRAPPAPSWRGEVLRREPRRPPARGEGRGWRDEPRSPPPSLPRRPRALGARRGSPLPGGPPRLRQLRRRGRRAPPASATSGACPGQQEKLRAQPGRGRAGGPA